MTISVRLDTRKLDQIAAGLNKNTAHVIKMLAFKVEQKAKPLSPIDLGALRNSIYTVTKDYDGFSEASAAAKAKNPNVEIVRIPKPENDLTANVGPCVDYGVYQEFGVESRHIPAHPYMTPAAHAVESDLNSGKTWEELFKK